MEKIGLLFNFQAKKKLVSLIEFTIYLNLI